MTTANLSRPVRCEPAPFSAPGANFGRVAREQTGRFFIGLTEGYPFKSLAALCRRIRWSRSNASRTQSGEQSPSYETIADAYASHVLPLEVEESGPPLDPRSPKFTAADCDLDGDGIPCDPDDRRIARSWLRWLTDRLDTEASGPVRKALGRAVAWIGALISHMERHPDGVGAGTGI